MLRSMRGEKKTKSMILDGRRPVATVTSPNVSRQFDSDQPAAGIGQVRRPGDLLRVFIWSDKDGFSNEA